MNEGHERHAHKFVVKGYDTITRLAALSENDIEELGGNDIPESTVKIKHSLRSMMRSSTSSSLHFLETSRRGNTPQQELVYCIKGSGHHSQLAPTNTHVHVHVHHIQNTIKPVNSTPWMGFTQAQYNEESHLQVWGILHKSHHFIVWRWFCDVHWSSEAQRIVWYMLFVSE